MHIYKYNIYINIYIIIYNNITEERSSHLLRGGSLKSRKHIYIYAYICIYIYIYIYI